MVVEPGDVFFEFVRVVGGENAFDRVLRSDRLVFKITCLISGGLGAGRIRAVRSPGGGARLGSAGGGQGDMLDHLLTYLKQNDGHAQVLEPVRDYRQRYGVG